MVLEMIHCRLQYRLKMSGPLDTFSTRGHCVGGAHVDHTLKSFCITRGPNKANFLSPSLLHLRGVCVFPKTNVIQGSIPYNKNYMYKLKS